MSRLSYFKPGILKLRVSRFGLDSVKNRLRYPRGAAHTPADGPGYTAVAKNESVEILLHSLYKPSSGYSRRIRQ